MKISDLRKAQELYDKQDEARDKYRFDSPEIENLWNEYWDFQKSISRENGCCWSLHSIISSVYNNRNVAMKDRFKVIVKVLRAMNIEIIAEVREQ